METNLEKIRKVMGDFSAAATGVVCDVLRTDCLRRERTNQSYLHQGCCEEKDNNVESGGYMMEGCRG